MFQRQILLTKEYSQKKEEEKKKNSEDKEITLTQWEGGFA